VPSASHSLFYGNFNSRPSCCLVGPQMSTRRSSLSATTVNKTQTSGSSSNACLPLGLAASTSLGRAVSSGGSLVAGFPQRRPAFEPGSRHVGFVVDRAALGQVSSEYFGFPSHSFHRLLHTHHHPPSGVGTVGQTVTDIPSGLILTLPQENKKNYFHVLGPSSSL
jgi:hypothetical protein